MSSLDKLAIRGIRSFDHNELSVMQFFTPLTVIVGHNGSGKTTIIECLKYATTGDLPPNTKGGAFVHDPSIAGTSEVKAQVKLRFFNTRKQKMLVERRLQVTKKKNVSGLTMKTLEANITLLDEDKDSKKRNSLSTKCATLDEEVSSQLGVSKAILENVIFCHQEESNWPLSEPGPLKKKFDDIFEATKYTKALDQIKQLRKEQTVEIKVDKEKLSALKTDRDRATKLKKAIDELASSIDVKSAEHEQLEEQIAELVRANKTFFNQATKYQDIIGKAETLRERRKLVEDNLVQVRANLTELQDSDTELASKIENHMGDLQALKTEREGFKQKLGDETDSLAAFERKRSQAQTAHGRLLAQKQRHSENLDARLSLIRELSVKHHIPGYDHELNEDEITQFEDKLDRAVVAQGTKIDKIKREARATEQEHQQKIQALKSSQAADERAKKTTTDQIRMCNSRIANINRQLDASTTTVADITYKEATLAEETRRKSELEEDVKKANYLQQYRDKGKEQKELEERREQLHVELTSLNTQSNVRAKLQLKRSENKKKDEAIQSLLDKSAGSFRRFTKTDPVRATMEAEVNAVVATLEADLAAAERSSKDAARELQSVETSVNISKRKLKELTQNASASKKKIDDNLKGFDTDAKSVDAAIKEAEEELSFCRIELAEKQEFVKFYQTILNKGKKDRVCLGCDRAISHSELPDFERYCKRKQDRAPTEMQDAQEQLGGWEKQLGELKRLLPVELTLSKLVKDDIPAAEKEAEIDSSKLPAVKAKAEEATARLSELQDQLRDLQMLKRTASDVMRMHRECEDIARDIAKLESELSASGSTATSEDIQSQLSELSEKIRAIKTTVDKIRAEQQTQTNTIQTLSNSIHSTEMDLAGKRQELKDKDALEQRKEGEREEVAKLDAQLKELDTRLSSGAAPIRKAEDELSQARSEFAQTEAIASRELQSYNKSAEQLDINKREIKSYETRGGAAELAKCERDLKQHDAVIGDTKARITTLQTQIASADKRLADSSAVLRNFNDNLRLRSERKNLTAIDDELEGLDDEGARKAYRKYETDYNVQRKKQTDRQAAQAKLGGELEMMKKDLNDKCDELKTEYDDIETKYKTELVKVKTTEMANDDLNKYAKALDAAIMQFHSLKMKEINDTIADLWNKTYQGTDIDKIMIKSDAEGKITGTKQSYNYRVVMFKDTTEMDMRGRCSAGQKVLASIIIRLALAESFGVNCGIMALDEPTTNLDHDNIQALAAALSDLIKDRRSQSNFQLIVITHDETFLETLGGSGVIHHYWRISRGDGGQVSTIERQRLN